MRRDGLAKVLGLVGLLAALAPGAARAQGEGILEVRCNVEGALVYVDGERLGPAPITEVIEAGAHVVRVERPAYATHEESIQLPADAAVEVVATLQRVLPGLEVTVDVETARVLLDGKEVGTGSVVVDPTTAGSHTLVVEGGDYGRYEGKIEVPPGRLTPVQVKLRGSLGTLLVQSDPDGATITVDGREAGVTPATVEPVKPGSHGVRIHKDGYADVLQAVVVEPGQQVRIDALLPEEGGTLEVRPSPGSATVWVNGVEVGSGRQSIGPLKPGMYSVRVTAIGHSDFVQPVQVEVGRKVAVAARLQPFGDSGGTTALPVTKRPAFWAGIGGGAAAVVAGVVITAAVVGARDPGGGPTIVPGTEPPDTTYAWQLP